MQRPGVGDGFGHRQSNKPVLSLVNSAVNMSLPAFAAERRAAAPCCGAVAAGRSPLSSDISSQHGAQQQTRRRTSLLRSNDGTDGQTDTRPLHRPCYAYHAVSAKTVV